MIALKLLEQLVGRRFMWKLGRRIYLHARREGSLEIESNGEAALVDAMAAQAARERRALRVIDVGANYGQWSTALLRAVRMKAAPPVELTMFEPIPSVRERLSRSMSDWGDVAHVTIEGRALSDRSGRAIMVMTGEGAGSHHLKAGGHNFEGDALEVEVTTLDEYLSADSTAHIDFIKIDAEGADPKVIEGMKRLLSRGGVDIVQFEYSIHFVRSRAYLLDIFNMAEASGYRVAHVMSDYLELHECWHPDLERFYASPMLLIRKGASTYLPAKEARYLADNTRVIA